MISEQIEAFLRETNPRTLIVAAIALTLIGILAGVLYGIKPKYLEYADTTLRHENSLDAAALDGGGGSSAAISELEAQVAELRDRLYGGSSEVPRAQIESFVVRSLDILSERHGVRLLGITPDDPTSVWRFEELPYTVEVEGPYFAIHRWLYDVEEELRPMVVKQFDLSPSREDNGVVLDLRVVAYRASEGQAI